MPSAILGWEDQGLAFDVAVHVGSLLAVLIYFKKDLTVLLSAWFKATQGAKSDSESRMLWFIIMATLPAAVVGLVAGGYIELHLRSIAVIATTTIVFGLLGWADWRYRGSLSIKDIIKRGNRPY